MKQIFGPDVLKAIGIGVIVMIIITAIMVPLVLGGILPVEQPFAARFARALFGEGTPLPVGMLLHALYVVFWATLFVLFWAHRPFVNAVILSGVLWLIQVALFYPMVGWGFLGLEVSITSALVSLIPHILLLIVLWVTGSLISRRHNKTA